MILTTSPIECSLAKKLRAYHHLCNMSPWHGNKTLYLSHILNLNCFTCTLKYTRCLQIKLPDLLWWRFFFHILHFFLWNKIDKKQCCLKFRNKMHKLNNTNTFPNIWWYSNKENLSWHKKKNHTHHICFMHIFVRQFAIHNFQQHTSMFNIVTKSIFYCYWHIPTLACLPLCLNKLILTQTLTFYVHKTRAKYYTTHITVIKKVN